MKYFFDTEFIEGFHKPLFGKKRHFIDLISIGIKCEDGREYYAISKEFNPGDADQWVKDNVISKLPVRYVDFHDSPRLKGESMLWRSNDQIRLDILKFTGCWPDQLFWRVGNHVPEFYAYFADYDWVVFCSLFGRMIDLPKGFPMYCRDLKQMLDESVEGMRFSKRKFFDTMSSTDKMLTLKEKIDRIRSHEDFPKQENEHNALDDARWNLELYQFIQQL